MTENEALEYIKNMAFMCGEYEKCQYGHQCTTKCLKATEIAIKALEEIQQYRAIGTVEDIQSMKDNGAFSGVELAQLAVMQMRLRDYQAIGTIEEFKALKEKNETLKALYEDARKEGSHLIARERAKAIDEFAEKLIKHISQMPSGYIGSGNVLIIAEHMKAGGKNEND